MKTPELLDVSVPGGTLRVARWPGRAGAPVAIAAHGITATHRAWSKIAEHLGDDVTLIAPDLRGRGGSNAIAGPAGIARHTDDLVAVLDHLQIESAPFAGHSMGAFVVAAAGVRHPARVSSLVIIDGGMPLVDVAPGTDVDIDALLQQIIGPSLERLKTTFPSREAYHDFWRQHPAFLGGYDAHVEAYVDYDLTGDPPGLRSGVSLDAVYADSRDTLIDVETITAIERITQPAVFVWATRGVMDQQPGFYEPAAVRALQAKVPHLQTDRVDANHFMLLLGNGAPVVADHIRKACGA